MLRRLHRFARDMRAAIAIEFVIAFPIVFLMFLVMLELTVLMARTTLLHHALDVTMRDVRLGTIVNPTVVGLEQAVCSNMTTVPGCQSSLALEFTQVDQATFAMPGALAPCARRSDAVQAARATDTYNTGSENELMVVRACMVVDSITPVLGSTFELFARTAFVIEPEQ